MPDYIYQWLNQTWIIVVAVMAGLTSIWKFKGTLKEMNDEIRKPVNEINEKLGRIEESNKLRDDALLTMQRKSLLDSCQMYLSKGYATSEEKLTVNTQFESYKNLGGNSFIVDMVDRVNDLPFEPKKKKKIKNDKVVE